MTCYLSLLFSPTRLCGCSMCLPHRHQSHIKRNNCFPVRFFFVASLSLSLFTGCSSLNADNDLDGRALHCRCFVARTQDAGGKFFINLSRSVYRYCFRWMGKFVGRPEKRRKITPTSKTVCLLCQRDHLEIENTN